ncbi:hypothetical protein K3495_g7310 [Podosphaera aphanis]|nr:hypothetical protein K3495_g7310 [Podosphaera aphanis]
MNFSSLDALGMTFHRSIMTCKVLEIVGCPAGHLHPTSVAVLFLQIANDLEEYYVQIYVNEQRGALVVLGIANDLELAEILAPSNEGH